MRPTARNLLAICPVVAVLAACSAALEQPDRGYECEADAKIMSLSQGEPATFRGILEVTSDGWIGVRLDAPTCLKLTRSNGKEIGPLAYDFLPVGVPVDGREQVTLPSTGKPVALLAEVDVLEPHPGDSPLLLRMLNVAVHDSPNREESE